LRILRERLQPGVIHGYVIALSRDFCLVAEVGDAIRFDGYIAIAVADISTMEIDPSREFVDKALALRGEELKVPKDFQLDDWAGIARSAAACAPLISVNMLEDDEGEISYVGQLDKVDANALVLRELDPNAAWYPDTGVYEFEALGSIGFATLIGLLAGWLAGNNWWITAFILIFAAAYATFQYFFADREALAMSGAVEVGSEDAPRFFRLVENLCIATGTPMPKLYVVEDPAPNAFATGRTPEQASITVTTGLFELMTDRELEGVLGHEIGHIRNYDIRVSLIVFGLVVAEHRRPQSRT
jgi:hypothetical protein